MSVEAASRRGTLKVAENKSYGMPILLIKRSKASSILRPYLTRAHCSTPPLAVLPAVHQIFLRGPDADHHVAGDTTYIFGLCSTVPQVPRGTVPTLYSAT